MVLKYEQEMRHLMIELVQEKGTTFKEALMLATQDSTLKERRFTTPLGRLEQKGKRSAPASSSGPPSGSLGEPPFKASRKDKTSQRGPQQGKGKGKGKSKSPQTSSTTGCARFAPDGRQIRYAFNNPKDNCTTCNFAHICGVCFKENVPLFKCGHAGKSGA